MSIKQKIFDTLVINGKQCTAAQLAARFGTTKASIAARISEIRNDGYTIRSEQRTDTKGRVKSFYCLG